MPDELLSNLRLPPPKKPSQRPGEVRDTGAPKARDANAKPQTVIDRALTFSVDEVLKTKRFDRMDATELEQAKRAIERFEWRIKPRRTRRLETAGRRGERLDVRGTVRAALRSHGEFVHLKRKSRASKPRDIVVLCDVSGSMERFARLLLHFTHALTQGRVKHRVESFDFGTRLTRITKALERLQKTSHRLIWLNPLIGTAGFKAQTRGLLAALGQIAKWLTAFVNHFRVKRVATKGVLHTLGADRFWAICG